MSTYVDIGIDLGTTYCAVAVSGKVELQQEYGEGTYLSASDVTIIPTPYGEMTWPSIVTTESDSDDALVFGSDAVSCADNGQPLIMFSKRKIGTTETFRLGSEEHARTLTAREVATELLKYIKSCAELALGVQVRRAVITHPAYFDRVAVEETRQAAIDAGLDMSLPGQMVMEPVAAALAYTHDDMRDPLRLLTYDLGGGTFDVTYLERADGVIAARAFDGNNLLGGYNFDKALANWLVEDLRERGRDVMLGEESAEDLAQLARLLQFAEHIKLDLADSFGLYGSESAATEELVARDDVAVQIRGRGILKDRTGREVPIDTQITQKEFVNLIAICLEQTVEHCTNAIEKAEANLDELDLILLVGGSSRGPWVRHALQNAFPDTECRMFEPDLCVAAGAARYADRMLPKVVAGASMQLTLDVPSSVAIEYVDISGTVDAAPADARIRLSSVSTPASAKILPIANDGGFEFVDIELEEQGKNIFRLEVLVQNNSLLSHDFSVDYLPEGADTAIMTVLPRSLSIETSDGMVTFAESGVQLPAQCEQTFLRQNANPSLTLRLFQDRYCIGEMRIDNIPPEAGVGSSVELRIEVTPEGHVCGTVEIWRDAVKLLHAPVTVRIVPPPPPAREDLEIRLAKLERSWNEVIDSDNEHKTMIMRVVEPRLKLAHKLFCQVPFDVQESAALVDTLEQMLAPPRDEMTPTLAEFMLLVAQCEEAIDAFAQRQPGDELEKGKRKRIIEQRHKKAERMRNVLNRLVCEGEKAHTEHNRRAWGNVYMTVRSLLGETQDNQSSASFPAAPISRLHATMRVNQLINRLNEKADQLKDKGFLEDWKIEIRRIFAGLTAALSKCESITDEMEPGQAMAVYRQIEESLITPLDHAVANIGVDIAKAGQELIDIGDEKVAGDAADRIGGATLQVVASGHSAIAQALLSSDSDLEQQDPNGRTPLMIATLSGDRDLVAHFISRGGDVNAVDNDHNTALMMAQDLDIARLLLDAGANVDTENAEQVTALLFMAVEGLTDNVALLLDHGANIEHCWQTGATAAGVAAQKGHESTLKLLAERGANLAFEGGGGLTPLHYAALYGHAHIVEELARRSVPLDSVDAEHRTALFLAAIDNEAAAVEALLKAGADHEIRRSADLGTPLQIASWEGYEEVVEYLLAYGSDVQTRDHDGDTPLHNAAYHGHVSIMERIVAAGADLEVANTAGETPLIVAARGGQRAAVAWLVDHGADTEKCDSQGMNALQHAQASASNAAEVLQLT
jgi:molecular chaperone DnaK (HSP70)/ankyrin repeat protein